MTDTHSNTKTGLFTGLLNFFSFLIIAILVLSFFIVISQQRLIAKDEGFYIMAASQVLAGKNVYLDFFYPQMPLLPYFYSAWFQLVGESWANARLLSAIITTLLGLFLYHETRRRWGYTVGLIAIVLYTGSNYVFPWYTTVTTYALSAFLIFLSYCTLSRSRHPFSLFLSGLFFGFAVETRLMMLGIIPFIFVWLFFKEKNIPRLLGLYTIFLLASIISLLPTIYLFFQYNDLFVYNNLVYHLERSTTAAPQVLTDKIKVLKILLGLKPTIKYLAPQIPILIYCNLLAVILLLIRRKGIDLSFYITAGLFVINFLPTPNYVQYYATLIPFLIIGVLICFANIYSFIGKKLIISIPFSLIPLALIGFYIYYVPFGKDNLSGDFIRYTKTGQGVIGIGNENNARNWNLEKVSMISNAVKRYSKKGDLVYSFWPGFLINTATKPYPASENHFTTLAADNLKNTKPKIAQLLAVFSLADNSKTNPNDESVDERRKKYHIMTTEQVKRLYEDKKLNLIILERKRLRRNNMGEILAEGGFKVKEQLPPVVIFQREKNT